MLQSFAHKRDERKYRNDYIKNLMLQIKIADKIGVRNFDYDVGMNFQEPKRYISLEEQLNNASFQRDMCYENAA
jgi:hypothetical protein